MKLRDYLKEREISPADFGRRIGLTAVSVTRYAAGTRIPREAHMVAIAQETGGAVTPNDFFGIVAAAPQPETGAAA